MPRTAWCSESEVRDAALAIPGVSSLPEGLNLGMTIESMIARVEAQTGFVPFLAGSASGAYVYDPPSWSRGESYLLDLEAGYASISQVVVGKSGGSAGTVLTENTDFWLDPPHAAIRKRPYTWIRFASAQGGDRQSIEVTGVRGFSIEIPSDLWAAALGFCVADVLTTLRHGDMGRVKQGPVDIEFRGEAGRGIVDRLNGEFARACARYRRG